MLSGMLAPCLADNSTAVQTKTANLPQTMSYIRKVDFEVLGAGCVSCVRRIEKMFKATPGVESAQISGFSPTHATIIYDMDKTSLKSLLDKLKEAGYGAKNTQDSFYRVTDNNTAKAKTTGALNLLDMPELKLPSGH